MLDTLQDESVCAAKSTAISCDLAGETVILDVSSGRYFALDPIGTEIWQCIQTPSTFAAICETLTRSYDVPLERCRADVAALLEHLSAQGLIDLREPTGKD